MNIPDKLFFKIGEAASIIKVEPYVLRYWESEFNILSPEKSKTGRRLYKKEDIELLLEIKRLLYEEKYSIEGAKRKLRQKAKVADNLEKFADVINFLKKELQSIMSELKEEIS